MTAFKLNALLFNYFNNVCIMTGIFLKSVDRFKDSENPVIPGGRSNTTPLLEGNTAETKSSAEA